jgi:cytochrome c oxidase subunit 3
MTDAAVPLGGAYRPEPLPVGGIERRGLGWWGVLCLIAAEAALFGYLLFSYYYCAVQLPVDWMPRVHPSFTLALPNTLVLIASSVAAWWGERGILHGRRWQLSLGLLIALLLGSIFLVVQTFEWRSKTYSLSSSLYGSFYFTITGFHMAHVVVGVAVLAALLVWSLLGYFDERRNAPVLIGNVYWHFVDVVWLFVFTTFYLTPYLW